MRPFRSSFVAALLPGALVLAAFFVWHWHNIAPVWRVLAEGVPGVAITAAAVGWAWQLSPGFRGPRGGLAFGLVFVAGLLLGEAIGLVRGPKPDPEGIVEILRALPWALLPVVAVGVVGARIAGWRGAAAYALAGLALLVYLGGSVVQQGGVGLGLSLLALLVPSYLVAGALLGWLSARLERAPART